MVSGNAGTSASSASILLVIQAFGKSVQSGQFLVWLAAFPGRNGISVRASLGMPQEGTNPLIQFRTDDVLELASLAAGFVVLDAKCVFEETFGQAMTADDVAGAA